MLSGEWKESETGLGLVPSSLHNQPNTDSMQFRIKVTDYSFEAVYLFIYYLYNNRLHGDHGVAGFKPNVFHFYWLVKILSQNFLSSWIWPAAIFKKIWRTCAWMSLSKKFLAKTYSIFIRRVPSIRLSWWTGAANCRFLSIIYHMYECGGIFTTFSFTANYHGIAQADSTNDVSAGLLKELFIKARYTNSGSSHWSW